MSATKDLTIRLRLDKEAAERAAKSHVEDLRKVSRAADAAGDSHKAAFGKASDAIGGTTKQLAGYATQLVAVAAAGKFINEASDAWLRVAKNAEQAAKASLAYRESLRIEAALKGAAGPDANIVNESLALRLKTGLRANDASNFERQFLGSLPIGIQKKNITQATADELKVQAGVMAARQGGDAGVRGDLAGILGQFGKVESAEAGLGQLEAIRLALTAGRGDDEPLTKALLNIAGSMAGEGMPVSSLPELASLLGVASLGPGAGSADTRTEQLARFAYGSTPQQMGFLKAEFGVGEKDTLEQRLDKIVPRLREQRAAGRDLKSYLVENQVPDEQVKAALEFETNYGPWKERLELSRSGAGLGKQVAADNAAFLKSELGRNMVGSAQRDAAEDLRGRKMMKLEALMEQQRAIDQMPGGAADSAMVQFHDSITGAIPGLSVIGGEQGRQRKSLMMRLGRLADAKGIDVSDLSAAGGKQWNTPAAASELVGKYDERFKAAGVDMFGEVGEMILKELQQINQGLAKQNQNPALPAPLPALPPAAKR